MTAPEPNPLRDRIAEALRTTPSELLDHAEDRARFAANSRKRHDRHNYSMDCAMCRGEVDTLADAVLAVVQPELDRLTADLAETHVLLASARDAVVAAGRRVGLMVAEVERVNAERDRLREEHAEDAGVIQALRRQRDEAEQHRDFLRAAVDVIRRADISSEQIWLYLKDQQVAIAVIVSDVFAWGGSDAEDITPEHLPVLEHAWLDCKAVDADERTVELYAARVRGMRPQGAAYPKEAAVAALFDACGPERPTGLGNPRKPPATTLDGP